jgi:hypothetical protein
MPNQRSKDKVRLGGFIERRLARLIKAEARRAGMQDNVFGFCMMLAERELRFRERRKKR